MRWDLISDLHIGVQDARDNFWHRGMKAFWEIVQQSERDGAGLVILGDLAEWWQNNWSQWMTRHANRYILDYLVDRGAVWVLGNHEDCLWWCASEYPDPDALPNRWLQHPAFSRICRQFAFEVADQKFLALHGHQADRYCRDTKPGEGHISAILSGLAEDRVGSPNLGYRSVEDAVVGPAERISSALDLLRGKPSRTVQLHRGLRDIAPDRIKLFGHTHRAGTLLEDGKPWALNSGSISAEVPSKIRIEPTGEAIVYDWIDGRPVENRTVLAW